MSDDVNESASPEEKSEPDGGRPDPPRKDERPLRNAYAALRSMLGPDSGAEDES